MLLNIKKVLMLFNEKKNGLYCYKILEEVSEYLIMKISRVHTGVELGKSTNWYTISKFLLLKMSLNCNNML